MKRFLFIATASMLANFSCALAQETQTAAPDSEAGLSAWAKIYEVVSHPRCANCHVDDGRPIWSGEHYGKTRIHGMNVGGNPDELLGPPGLMCNTCHTAENSPVPHGPPGNDVWHLPPKEMVWWQKSSSYICAQLKDPERNGGRTLGEIEEHVAEDSLVGWGWNPGAGREPAPYSAVQTANYIKAWAENGAPCPAE